MAIDLPLACVGAAYLLIYVPSRFLVARAQAKDPAGFDNKDPREQQARLSVAGKRALGAHNNSFEAFAPFAAAVLACELRHANERWTTFLSLAFVAVRIVYPWLYVAGIDKLRSLVWLLGAAATGALFVLAIVGAQ